VPIKTKIYSGQFEGVFKANYNAKDKDRLFSNSIDFDSFDIELVGEKKFIIDDIEEIDGINTDKYTNGLTSKHNAVSNVETHFPQTKNLKYNPVNRDWSTIIITNPLIPRESLTHQDNESFYGVIKGRAYHFERIYIPDPVRAKANLENESTVPTSTIRSSKSSKKDVVNKKTCFGENGCFSTTTPIFEQGGCFSGRRNSCFYPNSNSCFGSTLGCFNAPPFPCYSMPCFSGCFPGIIGGCFPSCFQLPLVRMIWNFLGVLGLIYIILLLLCNLRSSEFIEPGPMPIKEDEFEIVEEELLEENVIEEEVIDVIEDSEHQVLYVGEGNKVYLTVGDFDVQDHDMVNLYFNDVPIQLNYELIKSPQEIELSDIRLNQINTLRVEAISDGDKGVCTPQVFACHICGGESSCAPTTQIGLESGVENKNVGLITFYIEEQDCLDKLIESSDLQSTDSSEIKTTSGQKQCYNFFQFYILMSNNALTIAGYEWGGPILHTYFNPFNSRLEIEFKRYTDEGYMGNNSVFLEIDETGQIFNQSGERLFICTSELTGPSEDFKISPSNFIEKSSGRKINLSTKDRVEIDFPDLLLAKIVAGCECSKTRNW